MPAYSGCDIAASKTSRLALSTASSSAVLISASVGVAPSGFSRWPSSPLTRSDAMPLATSPAL